MVALTAGVVGSNLYNRLQGVDINEHSVAAPDLPPLSSKDSSSTLAPTATVAPLAAMPRPVAVQPVAQAQSIAPPAVSVAPSPVVRPTLVQPVPPVPQPRASMQTATRLDPTMTSGAIQATAVSPTAMAIAPAALKPDAAVSPVALAAPGAPAAPAPSARKRIANVPRLRLDTTLHDADWLPDAPPPTAAVTAH